VIVVLNEAPDRPLELPGTVVVLQLHDVLHRAMIPLDLSLRHRVVRLAACVAEPMLAQIRGEAPET
jgi:hypothetical protein